ncbi:MAG: hypothetical protein ACREBW_08930 [Candidatus Micrarchaeaceae archaeon]
MNIVWFAVFLVVSHVIVMQVFILTTYHRYFLPALPLLVGYSLLIGWLLFRFHFDAFFLWWVALESLWLFAKSRANARDADNLLHLGGDNADEVRAIATSTSRGKRFYAYSSFIYVSVVTVAYLVSLNT